MVGTWLKDGVNSWKCHLILMDSTLMRDFLVLLLSGALQNLLLFQRVGSPTWMNVFSFALEVLLKAAVVLLMPWHSMVMINISLLLRTISFSKSMSNYFNPAAVWCGRRATGYIERLAYITRLLIIQPWFFSLSWIYLWKSSEASFV